MVVAITGGGTGGHLSIAKALGVECAARGFSAIYIGSQSGQDRAWFESSAIFGAKYFLDSTGVVNKRGLGLVKSLFLQAKAVRKSAAILKAHGVDCVISVGGFSAGGASFAAILRRIPLFIHEQNSTMGTLNSLLAPFAKAVFGSFALNRKNFIQTSYPINLDFKKTARIRGQNGVENTQNNGIESAAKAPNSAKIETILFLGGSQGAKAINDFALKIAPKLRKMGIKIIHQCGKNDFTRISDGYAELFGANFAQDGAITLFDFDKNLLQWVQKADLCVSRAGASSLWELAANALPCYFVPYPYAAKNHQFSNALFLKNQGLCEVVEQKDLDERAFLAYLECADFAAISAKLFALDFQNGAREIIDFITKSA